MRPWPARLESGEVFRTERHRSGPQIKSSPIAWSTLLTSSPWKSEPPDTARSSVAASRPVGLVEWRVIAVPHLDCREAAFSVSGNPVVDTKQPRMR